MHGFTEGRRKNRMFSKITGIIKIHLRIKYMLVTSARHGERFKRKEVNIYNLVSQRVKKNANRIVF